MLLLHGVAAIVVQHFLIFINDVVHVKRAVGHAAVKVIGFLEAEFLYQVRHGTLVKLNLPVLQPPLEHLLCVSAVFHHHVLQRHAYFRLGAARLHDVQPLLLRLLRVCRYYLHLVAVLQRVTEGHHLVINLCSGASVADVRVYPVSEVKHGGTFGELHQVALRREDEHLVLIQVHLKLVNHLHVVLVLKSRSYAVEPLVESALALNALITPVGGQSALGYLIHALRPYLHFHPLVLRAEHGDVQALVAV